MDFSSLYSGIKELGKIYQKIDNIEIQKKLLDLSEQALEMQNEILRLQEENIKLKQKEDVSTKIERHKDAYITLKDDKEKIIYLEKTNNILNQIKDYLSNEKKDLN